MPHNIKTTPINFSHTLIKPNCSSYSTAIFPRFFSFPLPSSLSLFLSALPDVSLTIHHVTVSLFVSQQVGENVRSEHVFSSSTHLLNKRQEAPGAPSESRSLVKHCELKSLAPGEGGSCRFKKKKKKTGPRCLFLKHGKHQHLFVTLSMTNTEEFVLVVARRLANQARRRSVANARFPPTFVIRPRRVGEARCAASSDEDARQSRGGIWKETENTKSLFIKAPTDPTHCSPDAS